MPISQRTPTSGTAGVGATISVTLPSGTTTGDLVLVVWANVGSPNAATPTGWQKTAQFSAGSGQSITVYYAPYSAALTLSFVNANTNAVWCCASYFQAGFTILLDAVTNPVAASNTTSNTTLPTGAPTTGTLTGDYEALGYAWTSAATISAVASGSTIDQTQANSTVLSVAIGHNNTTSLGTGVTPTAFSQTLSAANTRKTGLGILISAVPPQTVAPTYWDDADAVYQPTVTIIAAQSVFPLRIGYDTDAIAFEPTVICLVVDTYASQEAFANYGDIELFQGTYAGMESSPCITAYPDPIPSAAVVYQPTVIPGVVSQTVNPNHIASAEVVFQPTVAGQVQPDTIGTAEQVYAIVAVRLLVQPNTISSAEQVFQPFVSLVILQQVAPATIASGEQVYGPSVVTQVRPDGIAGAPVVYAPAITVLARWCPPSLVPAPSPVAPILSGTVHVPAPGLARATRVSAPALSASAHHAAPALARAATSSAPPLREVELCRP